MYMLLQSAVIFGLCQPNTFGSVLVTNAANCEYAVHFFLCKLLFKKMFGAQIYVEIFTQHFYSLIQFQCLVYDTVI